MPLDFIVDNDLLMIFGSITLMGAIAVIIIELINFIPDFMASILNRMRNKTLSDEADSLSVTEWNNGLEPNLETSLDTKKGLNENDFFKRFVKQNE
ncbi:hypothetical protein MKX53_19630 [Psychrobacillus sp. FSL K6-4615]|uniref:hypothetical protein n=1 Tax=Psychrobacillus sp. FSL K6-4615 TaxID=2921551 RepID=UPI0030FCE61C